MVRDKTGRPQTTQPKKRWNFGGVKGYKRQDAPKLH